LLKPDLGPASAGLFLGSQSQGGRSRMALDEETLRGRAARLRERAATLKHAAEAIRDPAVCDGYTALIAEYDLMAIQLERMADDFASPKRS
jgi:hypothetical protein